MPLPEPELAAGARPPLRCGDRGPCAVGAPQRLGRRALPGGRQGAGRVATAQRRPGARAARHRSRAGPDERAVHARTQRPPVHLLHGPNRRAPGVQGVVRATRSQRHGSEKRRRKDFM